MFIFTENIEEHVTVNKNSGARHPSPLAWAIISSVVIRTVDFPRICPTNLTPHDLSRRSTFTKLKPCCLHDELHFRMRQNSHLLPDFQRDSYLTF